jgi:transcriptional regulator with XRE-family HTH domain
LVYAMDFAGRLRALMAERDISGNDLARRVPCDRSYVSLLASGKRQPSRRIARRIGDVLNDGGELETLASALHDPAPAVSGSAGDDWALDGRRDWDYLDAVERREMLRLGALGLLAGSSGELVRQLLERVLETAETYSPEDWDLACVDHMHAILTRPPAEVREGLIADLAALQRQLARARRDTVPDLRRATAWLSALYGNVLTRLGDYEPARRWWATARHAADACGDDAMRVWVRGAEAAFGLYAPRPAQSVVMLAATARRIAGRRPSPGLMCAMSAEAQALAALGNSARAERILGELAALCGNVDGAGYGWIDDSIWYVQSWVYAHLGRDDAAASAREQVIASSPSYQNVANAQLHEAISLARQGVDEPALKRAAQVVSELEPGYRSRMILHTARRVLGTVAIDQRGRQAAEDLRAALKAAELAI